MNDMKSEIYLLERANGLDPDYPEVWTQITQKGGGRGFLLMR